MPYLPSGCIAKFGVGITIPATGQKRPGYTEIRLQSIGLVDDKMPSLFEGHDVQIDELFLHAVPDRPIPGAIGKAHKVCQDAKKDGIDDPHITQTQGQAACLDRVDHSVSF